jgi:diguanylate cyclase (GGDEF)-like protein
MSANRGLFGRNRRPVQGEAPGTDGGKTSKARKKEEATEQSFALLGEVAAGFYGGDPSADSTMLALPPAPPPYVPEPIDHPHLGFTPIELPGGALIPSQDDEFEEDEAVADDHEQGSSRRFRRGSRRRRRRARLQAETDAFADRDAPTFDPTDTGYHFGADTHDPFEAAMALDTVGDSAFDVAGEPRVETIEGSPPITFEWSVAVDHFADDEPAPHLEDEPATEYATFASTYATEPVTERASDFPYYTPSAYDEATPEPVREPADQSETGPTMERRQPARLLRGAVTPNSERIERLGRGLELVFEPAHLWTLSSRGIGQLAPESNAELLSAADDGVLDRTFAVGPTVSHRGCTVPDRDMCPAMRLDRVMRFESSEFLDACPFLAIRDETVSAVCIPFRSQRAVAGVLHTTAPVDAPTSEAQADDLTVALALIGKRKYEISGAASEESSAEILQSTIEDLVQQGTPFAVALVHLDNFRLYNRAHGLEIGDAAVQRFDQVVRNVVRPEDMVAGDGGDEFFMVFPETTAKSAAVVCDRIRSELAASFVDDGLPDFTVSIGVADTDDGATFDELLAVIERAVVHAEAAGHDLVVSTKIIAEREGEGIEDLTSH